VLNAAARVVSGSNKFDRGLSRLLHTELNWLDVPERLAYKPSVMVYSCTHGQAPHSGDGLILEVCGSTRTRGYGSGTGRCLTGRVGYGYEVHGSGIPVFTRKEHHFSRRWSYIECFIYFFLLKILLTIKVETIAV